MSKLSDLLAVEAPKESEARVQGPRLTDIHLTRYTYEKAFRYAKLVMKRKSRNVEVGGFLIQPKDSTDRIARDAYLAKDQEVRVGFYELSPEDVVKAGRELDEQGQRIIGWWHSHGRFKTFHSDTDDKNQMILLNGISPSNYLSEVKERVIGNVETVVDGDRVMFFDPAEPEKKVEVKLKGASPDLVASELKFMEEQRIGFAYSLVVNHHRWRRFRVPYCEVATRDLCSTCMNPQDVSVTADFKIFDEGRFKLKNGELAAEIDTRVHLAGERGKKFFLPQDWKNRGKGGSQLVDPSTVNQEYFGGSHVFTDVETGELYDSQGKVTRVPIQIVDSKGNPIKRHSDGKGKGSEVGSQLDMFDDEDLNSAGTVPQGGAPQKSPLFDDFPLGDGDDPQDSLEIGSDQLEIGGKVRVDENAIAQLEIGGLLDEPEDTIDLRRKDLKIERIGEDIFFTDPETGHVYDMRGLRRTSMDVVDEPLRPVELRDQTIHYVGPDEEEESE